MSRRLFQFSALAALLGLVLVVVLIWPLPEVGLIADMDTGVITQIRPETLAEHAGLLRGDRIVSAYGYPWEANNTRLTLLPLPWRHGTPTSLLLERGGDLRHVVLYPGPPSVPSQIEKGLRLLTALICWAAGYLLGTSPRASELRMRWAGWFWVLMGLSIGLYHLADLTSYVLAVAVLWLQCTVMAPLAVALHLWYPSRSIAASTRARANACLIVAVALLQLTADLLVITAGSIASAYERMLRMTTLTFIGSFLISALVLTWAYHTTMVKHVRRQIRIIGLACAFVACWLVLLLLAFLIAPDLVALIPSGDATIGTAVIPLAYLATGVSADLMRLDQVARRVVISVLAGLMAVATVGVLVWTRLLEVSPATILIVTGSLYWPCFQLMQRLVNGDGLSDRTYEPLRQAAWELGSSLERLALVQLLREGFDRTFQRPPIALYCREDEDDEVLHLSEVRDLEVPSTVQLGLLNTLSERRIELLSASQVQARLGNQRLAEDETALVYSADMHYLGVIRNADNHVLALLVLGPRGDRDPYRAADVREMAHLLAAAALAFTNSGSFTSMRKARDETRRVFQYAQEIKQRTIANIVRILHNDVLNGVLFHNQMTLREVLARVQDPWVLEKLELIHRGEQDTRLRLRDFCDRLQPAGMSDLLGLEASLRKCTEYFGEMWGKRVYLEPVPQGTAVPVHARIHYHLLEIVTSALNNAIQHATDADLITISLSYPSRPGEDLVLSIRDNGRVWKPVIPRQGHFGLQFMKESARAVGLEIDWKALPDGGTEVVVWGVPRVPPSSEDEGEQFKRSLSTIPRGVDMAPEPVSADARPFNGRELTGEL